MNIKLTQWMIKGLMNHAETRAALHTKSISQMFDVIAYFPEGV